MPNNLRLRWKLVCWLIPTWQGQIWHSLSILTKSTLIIHRKVTSCQTSAKQHQMKMKIGILININMTKSNMALVFNIINFSLIIHRKVTCCQTSVKQPQIKMKIGIVININMTKSNMTFGFQYYQFFINYS